MIRTEDPIRWICENWGRMETEHVLFDWSITRTAAGSKARTRKSSIRTDTGHPIRIRELFRESDRWLVNQNPRTTPDEKREPNKDPRILPRIRIEVRVYNPRIWPNKIFPRTISPRTTPEYGREPLKRWLSLREPLKVRIVQCNFCTIAEFFWFCLLNPRFLMLISWFPTQNVNQSYHTN